MRACVRAFVCSCGRVFAHSIRSLARLIRSLACWLLLTLRGLSTPNKLKQNGSEYPPSQNWSEHQITMAGNMKNLEQLFMVLRNPENEKDEPREAPEKRFRR